MLTVDVDELATNLAEHPVVDSATIDTCDTTPRCGAQFAGEDELCLVILLQKIILPQEWNELWAIFDTKDTFNARTYASGAYQACVEAFTPQSTQGIYNDRLACTRLACEHVEALAKAEVQAINDCEVANLKLKEHKSVLSTHGVKPG